MDVRIGPVVSRILEDGLEADPENATFLGDHRFDGRLSDPAGADARLAQVEAQLAALEPVVPANADDEVDIAVTRTALGFERFALADTREATWNPMLSNPGRSLDALLSRDFAPLPDRVRSLEQRIGAIPAYLDAARTRFDELSRVHTETAVAQLSGTLALLAQIEADTGLDVAVGREAVGRHQAWLGDALATATRDPRLGPDLFATKLALALDTVFEPAALLARAEADLERVEDRIAEVAARLGEPDVRAALDRLAADAPDDDSILKLCRTSLRATTEFVRSADLVTVFDDLIEVIEMPEIDRGVAVAYCLPRGPLESAPLPTQYAVSPTPSDWSTDRVSSFYREYNCHMIHNLTVHEAMPGHALQLAHSMRHRGSTLARAVWWSGSFVEGWAVYAEELMVRAGYRADESPQAAAALEMQQLKMQLRMIINTIIDVRFHCADLDERTALELMMVRGHQEEGEAVGKWRRVQLSSTQLSTYYVGYCEVRDLVADLRRADPARPLRDLHDSLLAHGSPPVRRLRTLLGVRPGATGS